MHLGVPFSRIIPLQWYIQAPPESQNPRQLAGVSSFEMAPQCLMQLILAGHLVCDMAPWVAQGVHFEP